MTDFFDGPKQLKERCFEDTLEPYAKSVCVQKLYSNVYFQEEDERSFVNNLVYSSFPMGEFKSLHLLVVFKEMYTLTCKVSADLLLPSRIESGI